MVEIAIALGVISFALVAIVGILPTGLNTERENREETLINQDGPLLLEAIRSGGRGMDMLTNYVINVAMTVTDSNSAVTHFVYDRTSAGGVVNGTNLNGNMRDGRWIVGLMSQPKYGPAPGQTNRVEVRSHSMSGAAVEQAPASQDMGFTYSVLCDIVPINFNGFQADTNRPFAPDPHLVKLQGNLYEIRLNFRWPVLPNGQVGPHRKIFRTHTSGQLVPETAPDGVTPLFFFRSDNFASLK
jgi:hypothetical protein